MEQKIDPQRRALQIQFYEAWAERNGRGFVSAYTGFGKSYVGFLCAKRYFSKPREEFLDVVVDSLPNKTKWEGDLLEWGLPVDQCRVFVVNTYAKMSIEERTKGMLLVDEADIMANESAEVFHTVFDTRSKFVLALSATFTPTQVKTLTIKNIPCVGKLTWEDAKDNKWAKEVSQYNVKVHFTPQESEEYDTCTRRIKYGMSMCDGEGLDGLYARMAYPYCRERVEQFNSKYRDAIAMGRMRARSVKEVYQACLLAGKAVSARQKLIADCEAKMDASEDILEEFRGKKAIVFCKSHEFADALAERLGPRAAAFHQKINPPTTKETVLKRFPKTEKGKISLQKFAMKKDVRIFEDDKGIWAEHTVEKKTHNHKDWLDMVLKSFTEGDLEVLITVKKLDRGFDYSKIELGLLVAGTSSEVQFMQRMGRVVRKDGDRKATIVNLYVDSPKDLQSLKSRQKNLSMDEVDWVDSVDELMDKLKKD